MNLGSVIMNYREEHHLSQRQFAMKCGLSNGYIAMIEKNENPATGKPLAVSLTVVKAIASAMNMSADELMRISDGKTLVSLEAEPPDIESVQSSKGAKRIYSFAHEYVSMSPEAQAYIDGRLDELFENVKERFGGRSANDDAGF